ncbi:MAG: argininosuccinate lyase [Nitrospirota bacterium]|nr:argininosuccinate lyase [Nitrospirota bacterium]MDE3241749.1 argininosuccinate lyase [Nitrospirota bacterium]
MKKKRVPSGVGPQTGKLWAGRFTERTHELVEAFTSSLAVDRRLYAHDIEGSIAHAKTLERARVLSRRETAAILRGLATVRAELDKGRFPFVPQDEDIHMAIERRLTELIGSVGGKLHTGRSRNDQVALDLRLYLRQELGRLIERATRLQQSLIGQARAHRDVAMPGYTHLQRAQPVLFAHHLLAYVEMLERDKGRLRDALTRTNVMPLGSGALAGSNYPVDRAYTAKLLGFPRVTENSLDAVSDRDCAVEALAALSLIMMHLSRLSEELVLWSSQEFRFVDLPDGFCTGSSMMPQKKNPDVPELVRGKTGRVYGHLLGLLTTLKGLPLSYNRDLQEDKEALFDALDTVSASVDVLAELLKGLMVNRKALAESVESGYLLATELADYLVTKGLPFRQAHAVTGRIVRACVEGDRDLRDLTVADLRTFSDRFQKDALAVITVDGALRRKAQVGGTAPQRVAARIREWERALR